MSARKKRVILGPDGRPYVAPKPKTEPRAAEPVQGLRYSHMLTDEAHSFDVGRWLTAASFSFTLSTADSDRAGSKPVIRKPTLADAVARDVAALTDGFEGQSVAELPAAPRDLTGYADAFASARKKCPHENVTETMYARREGFCEDCRRFVRYTPGGIFGGGKWA